MADALAEDGGDDAVRRPLHQLPGKAAADAVAHVEELVDPEVIHQAELIVGERLPGVVDRHGAGGLAAIGVALVHGDAAEIVGERLHRVDHRGRPVADAGVQAATGGDQQREAGAGLLVADADIALVIERHGSLSLSSGVLCGRSRLDEPREHLESSSRHGCAAPLLIGDSCTRSGAAGQGWRPPGCDHRVVDGRPRVHNPLLIRFAQK